MECNLSSGLRYHGWQILSWQPLAPSRTSRMGKSSCFFRVQNMNQCITEPHPSSINTRLLEYSAFTHNIKGWEPEMSKLHVGCKRDIYKFIYLKTPEGLSSTTKSTHGVSKPSQSYWSKNKMAKCISYNTKLNKCQNRMFIHLIRSNKASRKHGYCFVLALLKSWSTALTPLWFSLLNLITEAVTKSRNSDVQRTSLQHWRWY